MILHQFKALCPFFPPISYEVRVLKILLAPTLDNFDTVWSISNEMYWPKHEMNSIQIFENCILVTISLHKLSGGQWGSTDYIG